LGVVIAVVGLAFMGSQPIIGWGLIALALASTINSLFIAPNHITAWATGAEGEARTARFLEPLRAEGFAIFHDRRIPGGRANIDHIVIGPPGVYVIETKSLAGDLRIRRGEVYVSGRRKTAMIEEVKREALAVQVALAAELEALGLPVIPVICVHRANLPWLGADAGGVRIVSGKELVKGLRKAPVRLGPGEAERLVSAADQRLAAAAGQQPRG
jgi:Nuclease-related domain.